MANPIVKVGIAAAKAAAKAAGKNVKPSLKTAQKAKPLANPKSAVRVKPAAKPIPNKPNAAKTMFKNDSSRNRASDRTIKEFEKNVIRHGERPTDPSFGSKLAERVALNTQLKRKPNLKKKSK